MEAFCWSWGTKATSQWLWEWLPRDSNNSTNSASSTNSALRDYPEICSAWRSSHEQDRARSLDRWHRPKCGQLRLLRPICQSGRFSVGEYCEGIEGLQVPLWAIEEELNGKIHHELLRAFFLLSSHCHLVINSDLSCGSVEQLAMHNRTHNNKKYYVHNRSSKPMLSVKAAASGSSLFVAEARCN